MDIKHYLIKKLLLEGVDEIVVENTSTDSKQIKFANNKIVKTGSEANSNIEIFIAKDKKLVSTSLKDPTEKNADLLIKKVISFLQFVKPNENFKGLAKGPFKYQAVPDTYDKKLLDLDMVDAVEAAINKALENSNRTNGILEVSESKKYLLTSNDVEASEKGTSGYFSMRALASKDASGHNVANSRILSEFDFETAANRASETAKRALNPIAGEPGKYNIIFEPLPFANLLDYTGSAASIFDVEAGLSFLAGKLGKEIGNFTLVDDATIPNAPFSTSFDSEGSPTKRTVLVDNGVLKTYLHNHSSAQTYNLDNTANAGIISPHSWNLVFNAEQGDIFDVKKALWITNTWYTRFQNYSTGDFSTIPRDGIFLIENGEVKQSLKNIRISDNILNILKNVKLAGKDKERILSWETEKPVITPAVLVKDVNVSRPLV